MKTLFDWNWYFKKICRAQVDLLEFSSSVFLVLEVYQRIGQDQEQSPHNQCIKGLFLTWNEELLEVTSQNQY